MSSAELPYFAFLEFEDQLTDLSNWCLRENVERKHIKLVTPNPGLRLKSKIEGYNVFSSYDYFSNISHLSCSKKLSVFLNSLEKKLHFEVLSSFENSFKFVLIFNLQFLIAHILYVTEIINNFLNKDLSIRTVLIIDRGNVYNGKFLMGDKERYSQQILNSLSKLKNLNTINVSPQSESKRKVRNGIILRFASLLYRSRFEFKELNGPGITSAQKMLIKNLLKMGEEKIVLLKTSRSLTFLQKINKLFFSLTAFFTPELLMQKIKEKYGASFSEVIDLELLSYTEVLSNEEIHIFDRFIDAIGMLQIAENGLNLIDFIKQKILIDYYPLIIDELKLIKGTMFLFEKYKPSKIYNIDNVSLPSYVSDCSLMFDFKSYLISHGAHGPVVCKEWQDELLRHGRGLTLSEKAIVLVQSDRTEDFIRQSNIIVNFERVSPLAWGGRGKCLGEIRRKYLGISSKKLVVLASTQKPRNSHRFVMYETPDEYIENIKDLIESVSKRDDVFLLIRHRSSDMLSAEVLMQYLPTNNYYKIDSSDNFQDLLEELDVLISFSSTTLEEALFCGKKVIEYDRHGRFLLLQENREENIYACSKNGLDEIWDTVF